MNRAESCAAHCRDPHLAEILKHAAMAALEAGAIIRNLYGKPHQIRHKGVIDLVTEADVASEKAILALLTARFPEIQVLAEESAADFSKIPTGAAWIVDPLDGTTNFAHSLPFFGVSIAHTVDGKPNAGVIYLPMQDELFCAAQDSGAWLNNEPIAVSGSSKMIESLVATGFPYEVEKTLEQVIAAIKAMLPRVRDLRRAGAAALDLAYVACGRLDAFWEMNLKPWDTAAGEVIVREAGGRLSNFSGRDFSNFFPETLASNGLLHDTMVEILRKTSKS